MEIASDRQMTDRVWGALVGVLFASTVFLVAQVVDGGGGDGRGEGEDKGGAVVETIDNIPMYFEQEDGSEMLMRCEVKVTRARIDVGVCEVAGG